MKVLHIANFGYRKSGATYYNTDRKISAGLIQNGHFVYDFSFRDMAKLNTIFKTKKLGASWANKEVLKLVDNIRPELVLIGHSDLLTAQTLQSIKHLYPSTKIAFWYVDRINDPHRIQYIKDFSRYLDAVFCTTAGELLMQFKQSHNAVAYMPNICSASIEVLRNYEKTQFDIDLLFCGIVYKEPVREQFLQNAQQLLNRQQINFQIVGSFGKPAIYGAGYYELLSRSQMGLSYSRSNDMPLYASDRIAQLTGNGLLTFSPKITDFQKLYSNDEIVYFENLADLVEKVVFYKNNPTKSQKIAQAGYQKTHQHYNAQRVTKFMLELIWRNNFSEHYEWQDEVYT